MSRTLSPGMRRARKPELLDQVPAVLRLKHYNTRTEQSYVDWIKRFILFLDCSMFDVGSLGLCRSTVLTDISTGSLVLRPDVCNPA